MASLKELLREMIYKINKTENEKVSSVNGIMPDKNGNVEVDALPNDKEQIVMLIEADMLPAVHENGVILTDENGNVILRY